MGKWEVCSQSVGVCHLIALISESNLRGYVIGMPLDTPSPIANRLDAPLIGRTYDGLPCGQGVGTILEVLRNKAGQWTRVRIRYASGCMPISPKGRPKAPIKEWRLPQDEIWIGRREWEELSPKLRGKDRTPALKLIPKREKRGR